MLVGLVAENRPDDKVVALIPPEVKKLTDLGIEVVVETDAGKGVNFGDEDYAAAGAKIVDRSTAYRSELVVRENEISRSELEQMIPGNISMSMLHYDGVPQRRIDLEETGVVGVALDFITDDFGRRAVYLWELTAENGMKAGYELVDKPAEECVVKLMGYGNLARGAMTYASRAGSDVMVLNKKRMKEIGKHLPGTDLLVNCVNWPLEKRGKELIVTRDQVKNIMRPGSVIVDLVVNPPGDSPIETCRPTYLDNNQYTDERVWHTCCWGWPNYTPGKASELYSKLIVPHIIEIATKGPLNVSENVRGAYVNINALGRRFR
jgi:alanine dehydrogenase